MPTEMISSAQQDESAVAAVRRGDAERYRELVERHERRVFAVAWSRLGDAGLAEEAAQEAFIRGYRRLWLLGDGAKFAAWITAIARHAAINLGLRHRRELNKRERWALEQPAADSPTAGETTELCPPETLRQTLAELPAAHRECLVLFYLEGKSGAEAAATLGISESALRVRLHRARAAMRERLEEKLEGSLANLRPAKTLVPAVMATVLTSSPVKFVGGGVGAKILYYLLPIKFFFLFLWAIAVLPNLLLSLVTTRMEQRNFRDPEGFRARMYRKSRKRMFWVLPLLLAAPLLIPYFYLVILSPRFGINSFFLLLAVFLLPAIFFSARQLAINRTRYHVTAGFLSLLIMIPGWLAIGLGWLPVSANSTIMMFYILLVIIGFSSRPMRMDYNLFRRALQKMLATAAAEKSSTEATFLLNKSQLLSFARFLGNRLLVVDYLWRGHGLILRLPALKTVSLWDALASFGFYSTSGRRFSYLMLEWNGTVSAQLGVRDEAALRASEGRALSNAVALEKQVAVAVESAWRHFRNGDSALAERAVGQVPEADIFIVPPARSKAVRLLRGVMIFFLALMLVLNGLLFFRPAWMGGLKPVNVTEAEVRAFLGGITTNKNPIIHNTQRSYPGDPVVALDNCLVLPPANLFSPSALLAARQEVLRSGGFNPGGTLDSKYGGLGNSWTIGKAIAAGWFSLNDLGVDSGKMSEALHNPKLDSWRKIHFQLCQFQCSNDGTNYTVGQVNSLILAQLRLLRDVNCLDLVEREKIIQQLCALQVLSGEASAGRPPLRNWRDVRGLFYTPGWPVLQDTYCDLAALEILGGLDKIDREACIKMILKLHRGKGFFTPPNTDEQWRLQINGDARDSIAAFESLRILGALDRVKDLDKWQFRVASYRASKPDANGVRVLTWDEIEAWVCQQRLQEILRERKENPAAPVRSLLEP